MSTIIWTGEAAAPQQYWTWKWREMAKKLETRKRGTRNLQGSGRTRRRSRGCNYTWKSQTGSYVKELEGLIDMVVGTTNGVKFDMLVHVESIDEESIH